MIYLDSSVALAHLFVEDRAPPATMWEEGTLSSSRLLEYEIWTQVHKRRGSELDLNSVRELLGQLAFVDLTPPVLARALRPFPIPIRTLDALHLATMDYQRSHGHEIALASYDERLNAGAAALGIPLYRF